MMCTLNDKSFPPNFFPSNYSANFVCFLTTKENNYLLGWCFIGTLVLQMVYVGWRLGRDVFGKSRIHKLMLKFGSQYSLPQVDILGKKYRSLEVRYTFYFCLSYNYSYIKIDQILGLN